MLCGSWKHSYVHWYKIWKDVGISKQTVTVCCILWEITIHFVFKYPRTSCKSTIQSRKSTKLAQMYLMSSEQKCSRKHLLHLWRRITQLIFYVTSFIEIIKKSLRSIEDVNFFNFIRFNLLGSSHNGFPEMILLSINLSLLDYNVGNTVTIP